MSNSAYVDADVVAVADEGVMEADESESDSIVTVLVPTCTVSVKFIVVVRVVCGRLCLHKSAYATVVRMSIGLTKPSRLLRSRKQSNR